MTTSASGDATGSVTAFAPGTVANVGVGLDVFGLALEDVGDVVRATATDELGVEVTSVGVRPDRAPFPVEIDRVPLEPERNSAAIAVGSLLEAEAPERGVRLELEKGLPLSAGLGGSAASAVAGVVAAAGALQLDISPEQVLHHAARGERRGSGSEAGDNVAASLLGGWVLVRSTDPFDVVRLPVPAGLRVALAHPRSEVRTADARRALGETLRFGTAVRQWGNLGAVVAALYEGDLDLLARALPDAVAEPARASMVPGFHAVKAAAMDAGALGCSLSGSGPAVFALCEGETTARKAAGAMAAAFEEAGAAPVNVLMSRISPRGARVIGRTEGSEGRNPTRDPDGRPDP